MTTRCKFRCHYKSDQGSWVDVRLSPVYSDAPGSENKAFWDATPCGEISLQIANKAAAEMFEPNKEYYIDISTAEAA
jgi:hypothetical protein